MKMVLLCDREKWTWDELRSNPHWFNVSLMSLMQNEAEEMNRRNKAD
jgi:hypothetical protein